MLKIHTTLLFISLVAFLSVNATTHRAKGDDNLTSILKLPDDELRDRKIVEYIYNHYLYSSLYNNTVYPLHNAIRKYDQDHDQESEYENFASALINRRLFKFDEAERDLLKCISAAQKADQKFLLYTFYSNMGFVKTDKGEPLAALQSYQVAHHLAEDLNDGKLIATTDVNMSDLYSKLQLYTQALDYLGQAEGFCKLSPPKGWAIPCENIDLNKAEIYFKLKNKDSLNYYAKRLDNADNQLFDIERIRDRLHYYKYLLDKDYPKAIVIIKKLLSERKYDRNVDRWNLADSYYKLNKLDSAALIAREIINDDKLKSLQIRYQSYKLLSQIAQQQSDFKTASYENGLALNELETFLRNMINVDDLSSQMRLEQLESTYLIKTSNYKKEQALLIFGILLAILLIIIVCMFYFNVRQKRRYENIIYLNKTRELAFLNSHDVRKHLANILGICNLLTNENLNEGEVSQYYEYLLISAEQLDESIMTIERTLNEGDFNL